jgi:hypothetical protein
LPSPSSAERRRPWRRTSRSFAFARTIREARLHQAASLRALGRHAEALDALEQTLRRLPADADAWFLKMQATRRRHQARDPGRQAGAGAAKAARDYAVRIVSSVLAGLPYRARLVKALFLFCLLLAVPARAQDVTLRSAAQVSVGGEPGITVVTFESRTATTQVTSNADWLAIICGTSGTPDDRLSNGCLLRNGRGSYGRVITVAPNNTRTPRTGTVSIGDATVTITQAASVNEWSELNAGWFSVLYDRRYPADAEKTRGWVENARRLVGEKYRLGDLGRRVTVYLFPEPATFGDNWRVDEGTAFMTNDHQGAYIFYLTPSSPRYARQKSSLGIAKDTDDYHAKVIVHEFSHVIQAALLDRSGNTSSFISPLREHLAEYDGLYHSTATNRARALSLLRSWASRNDQTIICCSTLGDVSSIRIDEIYNAGALLMAFLAEKFGEGVHERLMSTRETSLAAAILAAGPFPSLDTLFNEMREWARRATSAAATPSGIR